MRGALIFILVFFAVGYVTTTNTMIPPGRDLYGLLNVPEVDYMVLGLPLTNLVISILNGVVYGIVVWGIYTLLSRRENDETETKKVKIIKQVME